MGTSTDGIVFYGFPVEEGEATHQRIWELCGEYDEDDDTDVLEPDEVVAKLYGWDETKLKYSFQWEKEHPSPVTIGMHCSCDYKMYYIAIKESEVTANRGYAKEFTPVTQPGWDDTLRDFCDRAGIQPPEKFGWYVVSMWC